jgi:hypothetical protein
MRMMMTMRDEHVTFPYQYLKAKTRKIASGWKTPTTAMIMRRSHRVFETGSSRNALSPI